MTDGDSDTALWEGPDNNANFSCRRSLPACLGFSGYALSLFARFLSSYLFLVLISMCLSVFSRSRKEHDMHTRTALQALLAILTPTCSLWPSRYIEFASIHRSHIDIPLEIIIEDMADGIIEFRNPVDDLANLISLGATANGHTIRIAIGWKWWISYLEWWVLFKPKPDYSSPCLCEYLSGELSDEVNNNIFSANSSPSSLPSSLSALGTSTSFPPLCLDCFPHGTKPSLKSGCKAKLEFTAFSPSLRTLSTAKIISAVPFILSERFPRRPQTLVSVLKRLGASHGPNLVVHSVSNVSIEYERTLCHVYQSFSGGRRDTSVNSLGTKIWRRDMLLLAFEAALLRRGWIERLAIQVSAK